MPTATCQERLVFLAASSRRELYELRLQNILLKEQAGSMR